MASAQTLARLNLAHQPRLITDISERLTFLASSSGLSPAPFAVRLVVELVQRQCIIRVGDAGLSGGSVVFIVRIGTVRVVHGGDTSRI